MSGILWQYQRDEPALDDNNTFTDFNAANATTNSFIIKEKITGQISNYDTKNVEILVLLRYLSSFQKTLDSPKINLDLNQFEKCAMMTKVRYFLQQIKRQHYQ